MASNAALWWVKSGASDPGIESAALSDSTNSARYGGGEVLLFNENPIVAKGGNIFQSEFSIRNSIAENPKVDGNGNDVQDMGLDGIDVQITGLIKDSDASNDSLTKLMSWINEGKTTSPFTEGRFGLRIDDFPYFNMVPTATYGYVLNNIVFIRDPDKDNKTGFVLNLRVGGDLRSWFNANNFFSE